MSQKSAFLLVPILLDTSLYRTYLMGYSFHYEYLRALCIVGVP